MEKVYRVQPENPFSPTINTMIRLENPDGSVTIFDPTGDTSDARAYANWLAAGNTPEPAE